MLGGVRSPLQVAEELAQDIAFWAAHGCGTWTIRDAGGGTFQGMTGFMQRPDGRGVALRFALWPAARGRGLAREAAGAALQFGHEQAGLSRVVAVAREDNIASRTVLGGIGMLEREEFVQRGYRMILYKSIRLPRPQTDTNGRVPVTCHPVTAGQLRHAGPPPRRPAPPATPGPRTAGPPHARPPAARPAPPRRPAPPSRPAPRRHGRACPGHQRTPSQPQPGERVIRRKPSSADWSPATWLPPSAAPHHRRRARTARPSRYTAA